MAIKKDSRANQVYEMIKAGVRFFPGLMNFEDREVEQLYRLWKHNGRPESVNIYWMEGGEKLDRIRVKRRTVRD